jgi:bacillithiol synthase
MLKAEKRHHSDKQRQIQTLRRFLNPKNSLQERTDNFMPLYAKYGKTILHVLLNSSSALEEGFGVLTL